ncbi:DEAD/DEAH box helicase [Arthrobacter glacialis]|uniref:Helicase n=1 Tax=Arthrobacter glacialis TaxID=1664 RepID=A0A2S3ZZJ9_ARTGL|nr:DEAD/DEAH box helicase [Arthrobacter glacialis]POH74671.1 helicase [Arthrobacter glacialis]
MAVSIEVLKTALATPNLMGNEFSILADIASLKSIHGNIPEIQDLVIRALDRHVEFHAELPLLMSLARDQGLFPYIDSIDSDLLSLPDLIALEMHRPEGLENVVFHRVQAEVYRKLMSGENVILSAPTSFGKTLIIDALIASGNYKNVVIIVPTIALIDEIRRRLSQKFHDFKIITHPGQAHGERNLFVLTQERFLALEDAPNPDLFFVDEFYKSNDQSVRADLLNQAIYRLMKTGAQYYFAAPTIQELSAFLPQDLRAALIVTDYSTVAADTYRINPRSNEERRAEIQRILKEIDGPTLIYCKSPHRAREVSEWLREDAPDGGYGAGMPDAADWLEDNFSDQWSLPKSLRLGFGPHHGKLPRWLGPLLVRGFEEGSLGVLVCTSTLIEGVNTQAKGIIILDKNIAKKAYDYFTFANIRGRGGRMLKHFIGKIYLFNAPPLFELPSIDIPGLSQSDSASDGLLLSIDDIDRTERAKERLREVLSQSFLSENTMKLNQGVDPHAQIELAKYLATASVTSLGKLLWNSAAPKYPELLAVVNLVWEFIPPLGLQSHGVTSAKQLTLFTQRMAGVDGDTKDLIAVLAGEPDGQRAYDKKIEETFDFIRFWIEHNLPALIRAVDRIAKEVLTSRGIQPGSYEAFASRMGHGFLPPLALTAEEYGIPSKVTKKLVAGLPAFKNLDGLLHYFKNLDQRKVAVLTDFERRLMDNALSDL